MSFPAAVRSVLTQYATFRGRARRSEYWWFALFSLLVTVVTTALDAGLGFAAEETGPFGALSALALLLPSLAVTARRLHDTGHSGWWMLVVLIPLAGIIILLVMTVRDSDYGDNAHGPSPKHPAGTTHGGYAYGVPPVPPVPVATPAPPAPQPALVPPAPLGEVAARDIAGGVFGPLAGDRDLVAQPGAHGWSFRTTDPTQAGFAVAVAHNGQARGYNTATERLEDVLAELASR